MWRTLFTSALDLRGSCERAERYARVEVRRCSEYVGYRGETLDNVIICDDRAVNNFTG